MSAPSGIDRLHAQPGHVPCAIGCDACRTYVRVCTGNGHKITDSELRCCECETRLYHVQREVIRLGDFVDTRNPRHRSFLIGHATPGALCDECDPYARADEGCESTEPQPAAYRVHLDPSDYEGNNFGPDEAGEHDLCLACLEHLAPWIANELHAADMAAAGYSNARDEQRPREPDDATHFRCEG